MNKVVCQIDGKDAETDKGTTILSAAESVGITIPTLCYHEMLTPFGACRMCIVEKEKDGKEELVVSCVAEIEEDCVIRTRSKKVDKYRKGLLELMLARAPHSPKLQTLAREYGAEADRLDKEPSFCIHCGLCVRYCAEVKKKYAVGFIDRGVRKEIRFVPEIASKECEKCKECFSLCPTSYLQAVYVLTQTLVFPKE